MTSYYSSEDSSEDDLDELIPASEDPDFFNLYGHRSLFIQTRLITKIHEYMGRYRQMPKSKRPRSLVKFRLMTMLIEALKEDKWSGPIYQEIWVDMLDYLTIGEILRYHRKWMERRGEDYPECPCVADLTDSLFGINK